MGHWMDEVTWVPGWGEYAHDLVCSICGTRNRVPDWSYRLDTGIGRCCDAEARAAAEERTRKFFDAHRAVANALGVELPSAIFRWEYPPTEDQVKQLRQATTREDYLRFLKEHIGKRMVVAHTRPGSFTDPWWLVQVCIRAGLEAKSMRVLEAPAYRYFSWYEW